MISQIIPAETGIGKNLVILVLRHMYPENTKFISLFLPMRLLLLIPALAYLLLLVINLQIFSASTQINFFWIWKFQIPVVIFISLFFILYILLIWVGFNFSNYFSKYKNERLEKEVSDLKGKLLDKQGELLQNIETNMRQILTEFKDESNKKIELYKKETEKVVSNMGYDFGSLKDKIEKIGK